MARTRPLKLAKSLILRYRRLSLRGQIAFWAAALLALVAFAPHPLSVPRLLPGQRSAVLYVSHPPDGDISVGHSFPLELRLRTQGQPINAVSSRVAIDPLAMEIVSMTTANSFCSFYTENSFDTIRGEVRIACGVPHPGFQGDSIVVRITLRPKTAGRIKIELDEKETSVLANDGKGTNLLRELPQPVLTVKQTF